MADSGEFGVLDCKLAAAFGRILNGEIGRQVNLAEEKAAKHGHMLKGRQIAYMVMDYFKITAQEGAILELDDLVSLQLHSNNLKKFTHEWESTLIGLKSAPSDDMLEALFKREIREADQLKETLALYDQDTHQKGTPSSYSRLMSMVKIHLESKRRQQNPTDLAGSRDSRGIRNACS